MNLVHQINALNEEGVINPLASPKVFQVDGEGWTWTAFGLAPAADNAQATGDVKIFPTEQAAWDDFRRLPIYFTSR